MTPEMMETLVAAFADLLGRVGVFFVACSVAVLVTAFVRAGVFIVNNDKGEI